MRQKFYPMLTSTLQSTLISIPPELMSEYVLLIINYPNIDKLQATKSDIATRVILTELDRQYDRWNKGGVNGTR